MGDVAIEPLSDVATNSSSFALTFVEPAPTVEETVTRTGKKGEKAKKPEKILKVSLIFF